MSAVPETTRLEATRAAAALRQRADAFRPDEELTEAIAKNTAVADQFARAYAALRELGLEDKALDRFGVENATPTEMREAADLLERLSGSDHVPGRKRRAYGRLPMKVVREYRAPALLFATLIILTFAVFGTLFAVRGVMKVEEWRTGDTTIDVPDKRPDVSPNSPLAPVPEGFERTATGEVVPPRPKDHVTDRAGVLTPERAQSLNARLTTFERETSNQFLVFIDRALPESTTLEALTVAAIRHWGVGQKGKDNGVILFVFTEDRVMRIEVGYGLEPLLTDGRSKRITSRVIKPLFREGKMAEGIEAGAAAIMEVTRGGEQAAAYDEPPRSVMRMLVVPLIFYFGVAAVCFLLIAFVIRHLILFWQGYATPLFRFRGGRGTGRSGSSSGGSSGSSSGSYSGGGGSGGGGGASDSW
jgi:uncharacterized protein